jgi:hypothetical protein
VGTRTNGSQRLQVHGDAFIKGSGATSGSAALTVQNSIGTSLLNVRNDGWTILNGTFQLDAIANFGSVGFYPSNTGGYAFSSGARALRYETVFGSFVSSPSAFAYNLFNSELGTAANISHTSMFGNFAPTSGTKVFQYLNISGTINQTGAANGITRGLYVNPTLTLATDWRSIETTNNSGYAIYAGGTANSYFGGSVGIGGLPVGGYRLRVYGSVWADGIGQLLSLDGSAGVGSIGFYQQGTLAMNVYGPHAAESVKGFFTIKSQDLSYTSPVSVILHADADFLDHPTMIIRSRNLSANSIYFQNYHYSLGALFTTLQPSGGNTDMTFRPNRTNRVVISDSSVAALSVESTTQGFRPPRMTTTEKNAIATPAAGLVVYDTTLNKLCVYTTAWQTITST